ncbi:MAG: serine/threonine-protein phosphatase, partial [Proteobacteria bacterium]|nr:serine/threonine-protein phosphatase [Pseudomonadota bacterium]
DEIFRGAARSCRSTRGVVMALARLDWSQSGIEYAGIGNIESKIVNGPSTQGFISRRGIVGLNAPRPLVTRNPWSPGHILVMYSDGLSSHWNWRDFAGLAEEPAGVLARHLLLKLAKDNDDATVLVVKTKTRGHDIPSGAALTEAG